MAGLLTGNKLTNKEPDDFRLSREMFKRREEFNRKLFERLGIPTSDEGRERNRMMFEHHLDVSRKFDDVTGGFFKELTKTLRKMLGTEDQFKDQFGGPDIDGR